MPYFGVPIRNGLPIGLGSQAGFGIAPFDPRDLFSAGEQGAWYDPSDYSTLFTNSAGTTPVTAVEQFVGLMLDKSKGAPTTLGAELVVNGDFATDTWWSKGADWTIGGGVASHAAGASFSNLFRNALLTIGKTYKITLDVVSISGGNLLVFAGGANFTTVSTPGSKSFILTCAGDTSFYLQAQASTIVSIDNVSIRELPGNHATSTGTKRPKLAARYNLLTYTEQFDNGAWTQTNVTITPNSIAAPNGTLTAETCAFTSTGYIGQTLTLSGSFTISVAFKRVATDWVCLEFFNSVDKAVWFNLNTGAIGTQSNAIGTIQDLGNGWYRCTVTATLTSALSSIAAFFSVTADNSFTRSGSCYVWGADLRPASQATGLIGPTYQRVVDAATYDTAGFLPYLQFDGIDDSMSTGSIDFTATDKMTVWAGVRKLSDAAQSVVAELSADINANNGTIRLQAPDAASPTYGWVSKGTTRRDAVPSGYAAPITNVLTGVGDISGDIAELRVNGTQAAINTNDQGTGNYGTYPLFIGARNNASLFFNGWLTSLIVRGAQSTDSQISATESWVAGKTGVSL